MTSLMSPEQERKCHKIIHSAAVGAGAGNLIPVPGTGLAADAVALTAMAMALAAIFGQNLTENAAKGVAMAALKRTALQQPVKMLGKELVKIVPWFGSVLAAGVSVAVLEATGWTLANEMARNHLALITHQDTSRFNASTYA